MVQGVEESFEPDSFEPDERDAGPAEACWDSDAAVVAAGLSASVAAGEDEGLQRRAGGDGTWDRSLEEREGEETDRQTEERSLEERYVESDFADLAHSEDMRDGQQ